MKKYSNLLILIFLSMFLGIFSVAALSSNLGPITQVGNKVLDDCGSDSCYGMGLKVSGNTPVICTDYYKTSPAVGNASCSISNDWKENIRYSVAAVINKAKSNISATQMTNNYFAAEMAINRFLYNKGVGGTEISGTALSSTYRTLYINYLDIANKAYDNYSSDAKVEIALSKSSLSFSLDGDNYVSNSVTVSGVDSYNVSTDVGNVIKTGNSFKVVVPSSEVILSRTVKVSVTSSKTLNQARNYDCGSSYQTVTPVALETITKSDSAEIAGTITAPKTTGKLTIKKLDEKGKFLPGVKIKIENSDKTYSKEFITEDKEIIIDDLKYGDYTIKEVSAPAHYLINEKVYKVVLSSTKDNEVVTITNKKTRVEIKKISAKDKKNLKGAKLQVQDEKGKKLYEWETTEEPYIIEGIDKGTYYLVEISAPEGYELNKEKRKFEVDGKTEIIKVEMENSLEVIVPDTLSARSALLLSIAMFDIAIGIGIITYVKKNKIKE